MRIGVLNGPNLNLLGTREPHIYGTRTLADIEAHLTTLGASLGAEVECAQRNGEGELLDVLHGWRERMDGLIVNAGAYTHTSMALQDGLAAVALPFVEVHISNIYAREPERRHSMLAAKALGMITGLGADGYAFALQALVAHLRAPAGRRA